MSHHSRPSLQFKPTAEACAKPSAGSKIQNLSIPTHIGGWLMALFLAVGTLPASGQMAATSNGKFVGNIFKSTTTVDPVFDTYWNQATPENSGKWEAVEATRDVMTWSDLDFMYAYTRTRGIPFKQHTFVWGQQSPAWITTLSEAEQREEVEEWIAAYGTRYPDTEFIDVVNEPLHAPAEYRAALGGAGTTGWDWVIWSFEKARLHCPNAKLLLNDYNILNSDSKTTQYLTIINLLKDRGLIDGIGEQAHFYETTSISTIQNNLNRLAATGLPIYISELDINLANDTAQSNRYQTLFPVFWTNPAVRGITFWGYKQGEIWQSNAYLLRTNGTERPALTWLKNYIAANPQSLSASVTAPADGQDFTADLLISASATITYGTAPFTVTFQKKLNTDTEFITVSSDNTPPYTADMGVLPVGTYQIRAIVTDNITATATSAANTFTVSPGPIVRSWDGGTTDIVGTGDGASTGGDGTWDTTIQNWDQGNGLAHVAWNNATNDTAIFGGAAGTISLGTGITVGGLTFASAYTVNSDTITFCAAGTISNSAPVTIASALAGTGPITKAGASPLTLSGSNTYTGATVISNGVLTISHNTALGDTTGNTTIAANGQSIGPQLALSGNINSEENFSVTGNTEQNNYSSVIYNTSGTNTLSGNITLPSPAGNIRVGSGGGELIFSGTISQTGTTRTLLLLAGAGSALTVNNAIANNNGALSVIGGGAVTLKGVSTAIGATTVGESGLLKLGVTNALKTNANLNIGFAYNFTGSDRGTFDLAGFNQTVNALTGTKNASNVGADSTRIVTNSVTGTSTLTVGNGNASGTFNGVILDGGVGKVVALTKIGAGDQTLVGASNYTGTTTVSAGRVVVTSASQLSSGSTSIMQSGTGQLFVNSGATISNPFNISGLGYPEAGDSQNNFDGGIRLNGGTISGQITLSGNSRIGGFRGSAGTHTHTVNSKITGAFGIDFYGFQNVANSGNVFLLGNAANDYTGNTTIYNSNYNTTNLAGVSTTLRLGASNVIPEGSSAGNVAFAINGTNNNAVVIFDLNGFNETINGLTVNAGTFATRITNTATSASVLTIGANDTTSSFSGTITDSGAGRTLALTKVGTGTLTLSGTNTYSGDTTVSGGTLTLANSNASNETSTVTIAAAGATLDLTYAGTDTVDKLFIAATQLAAGEYGNSSSVLPVIARSEITGTGTLTVTTGPGGGSTYAAWQTANSSAQTIDQDHDNDGVPNGVEYFLFGPVATSGFTPLPGVIDTAGTLSVTWTKAAGYTGVHGTDYVVETSATLVGAWAAQDASPTPGFTVTFPTANEVKFTFPAGIKNFARLKVTGP